MHIRKNVIKALWQILDGRSDKEKFVKISNDINEANNEMQNVILSNSNGDQNISAFPWLLTKQRCKRGHQKNQISHCIFFKHKEHPNKER